MTVTYCKTAKQTEWSYADFSIYLLGEKETKKFVVKNVIQKC